MTWQIKSFNSQKLLMITIIGEKWNVYLNVFFFFCSQEIRMATSSMTSVPKPLKFLRPHYGTLKGFYEKMPDSDLKATTPVLHFSILKSEYTHLHVLTSLDAVTSGRYSLCSGFDNVCWRRKGMFYIFWRILILWCDLKLL